MIQINKLFLIVLLVLFIPALTSGIEICQYAGSATATSENPAGSLAIYSTMAPNAPKVGQCSEWSGYGYTWSPQNWNIKANLTLHYNVPVLAKNFTIFGDYDMCWNKMFLKNSATGQQLLIFEGFDNSCIAFKQVNGKFLTDTIILETCGWSWSSTDAVGLCGNSTTAPMCGNGIKEGGEECDDENLIDEDGCSSECKIENVTVYFVSYMGDFDGSIGSGWYFFYDQVRQWHENNKIKGSFSFYPDTMNNPEFNKIIGKVYNGSSIELITKGESQYNGTYTNLMTYDQVKSVLGSMQNKFVTELTNLGYTSVKAPITYNQQGAKFTETIRNATHDLGFNFYMDQYVSSYGYISPLLDYDITQYSVSLTVSDKPGPDEVYKKPEQVINELLNFSNPHTIYINGIKVVPLLCHQQDFRISETSDVLNQTKWQIYTTLLLNARKDPRIAILKPQEVYNLRHPLLCGNSVIDLGEECDKGVNNGVACNPPYNGNCVYCSSSCKNITLNGGYCGDKIINGNEQCDDNNTISGDGCYNCIIENIIYSVEICDWQNCRAGVASISVDDSYTSCMDELNAHGFKGTYFLEGTNKFSQSTWKFWNSSYKNGHELGCHTQTHPCSQVSDSVLRSELSSNKNDILTHISMPSGELVSFAWPCGFNTEHEKQIASEYFLGSRGYYINQLEDKNPADFMEIKSFNTPGYNQPKDDPPDYRLVADSAESQGKWANFILHNECTDEGVIDYLPSKNLWVAPIGTVVKYIKERQNANILDFEATDSYLKFNLSDSLNHTIYNKELTIKTFIADKKPRLVKINGVSKNFSNYTNSNGTYVRFNILPSGNDRIEVIFLELGNCTDNDNDNYYAITPQCFVGIDCNDNNANINPGKKDLCDGVDNNCNLLIDEDYAITITTCGIGACVATGQTLCLYGLEVDNCTSSRPSNETCDGLDNDCDSLVDESLTAPLCEKQYGVCAGSIKACGGILGWLLCNASSYGSGYEVIEISCQDSKDNDCDSKVDIDDQDCTVHDLCAGVVCNDSRQVCPDDFITTCKNYCNNLTGMCSQCIPNCTGHEKITYQRVSYTFKIVSGNDDAEENIGKVSLNSPGLTIGSGYTSGFRFANINLPSGSVIENATLSLAYSWASDSLVNITLYGESSDNTSQFSSVKYNITSRAKTIANVEWVNLKKVGWGVYQNSSNINKIIQEIINRPNWRSGNSLSLIASNSRRGTWEAISYEGTNWNPGLYSAKLKITALIPSNYTSNQTINNSTKSIILQMDDCQVDWLEGTCRNIVDLHIQKGVDVVIGFIPEGLNRSSWGPYLQDWYQNHKEVVEIAEHTYDHSSQYIGWTTQQVAADMQKGLNEFAKLGIFPYAFVPAYGWAENTAEGANISGFHSVFDAFRNEYDSGFVGNVLVVDDGLYCGDNYNSCVNKDYAWLKQQADELIERKGYAIIAFHQQDFGEVNSTQYNLLYRKWSENIDKFKSDGYTFITTDEYYKSQR